MKFVLFLALGASRVLAESFPSREAKKRHKSDGTTETVIFCHKTEPSLLKNATKLWMKQVWLRDAGAKLMNVEGFAMNACKVK